MRADADVVWTEREVGATLQKQLAERVISISESDVMDLGAAVMDFVERLMKEDYTHPSHPLHKAWQDGFDSGEDEGYERGLRCRMDA